MIDKFTIISIDNSREDKKRNIRSRVGLEEVQVDCVNGKDDEQLKRAVKKWHDVELPGPFKRGEFGIFFSLLNVLEYSAEHGDLLVFEDDAMPRRDFNFKFNKYMENSPEDMDFCSIWVPEGQQKDYYYNVKYDDGGNPSWTGELTYDQSVYNVGHPWLSKVYQGFSLVTTVFTQQGSIKLLDYAREKGMFTPADCMIFIAAHTDRVNGYALNPRAEKIVEYDWNAPTTIHKSQWGSIQEFIGE